MQQNASLMAHVLHGISVALGFVLLTQRYFGLFIDLLHVQGIL